LLTFQVEWFISLHEWQKKKMKMPSSKFSYV
jgi:hypothetical protein